MQRPRDPAHPASVLDTEAVARRIALTMIVTLVASSAYVYWKQIAPRAQPPTAASRGAHGAPARVAAAATPAPGALASAQEQAADEQSKMVPVIVRLRNVNRENRVEGTVESLSPKPLSIILVGINRQGDETSRASILLAPFASKSFSANDGMDLQSGGHVLAQSQGYQDREASIP